MSNQFRYQKKAELDINNLKPNRIQPNASAVIAVKASADAGGPHLMLLQVHLQQLLVLLQLGRRRVWGLLPSCAAVRQPWSISCIRPRRCASSRKRPAGQRRDGGAAGADAPRRAMIAAATLIGCCRGGGGSMGGPSSRCCSVQGGGRQTAARGRRLLQGW